MALNKSQRPGTSSKGKAPLATPKLPIAKKKIPPFFHQSEDYASLKFVGPDGKEKPFGIEKAERPTTSTVVGFPDPPPPFVASRVLDKLRPEFPIHLDEPVPRRHRLWGPEEYVRVKALVEQGRLDGSG